MQHPKSRGTTPFLEAARVRWLGPSPQSIDRQDGRVFPSSRTKTGMPLATASQAERNFAPRVQPFAACRGATGLARQGIETVRNEVAVIEPFHSCECS